MTSYEIAAGCAAMQNGYDVIEERGKWERSDDKMAAGYDVIQNGG